MDINKFRRVEKKYLLTKEKYEKLILRMKDYIVPDKYDYSTICNVYFDSDNYDLIIRSIEKPKYKEKLRIRSYGIPNLNDKVFFELKKKYKDVVFKRRVSLSLKELYLYLEKGIMPNVDKQVMGEIDYCIKLYNLKPKIFIAYDRYSYKAIDNNDFRITFDSNIRSRDDSINLELGDSGNVLLKNGEYLMEVKTLDSYPLWFTNILSELKIYPSSFSKYGNVYKQKIKGVC